jgi:hypothetical protein
MFSVNNFYDYLRHKYECFEKDTRINAIRTFHPYGTKMLYGLYADLHADGTTDGATEVFTGTINCFDQEPVDINAFILDRDDGVTDEHHNFYLNSLSHKEFMFRYNARARLPLLCHSELNSVDVQEFEDNYHIPVYYWFHAIIARDWYRHYKLYNYNTTTDPKRFGLYARDASGTRTYRVNLLKDLSAIHNNVYFKFQPLIKELYKGPVVWDDADKTYDSHSSAHIEVADTGLFDIHLVAETLFDTPKIHLTEKVFKPVVMEQPFILFAGPGSLQYMRDYGFQTFGCCWDESYDEIANTEERYAAALDLINWINNLPAEKYKRLIERARLVAKNNREYFYSQQFEDRVLSEMHTNFDSALALQEEKFYTMPGGNWFYYQDLINNRGFAIIQSNKDKMRATVDIINQHWPTVAKDIVKQYGHLF